jgi:hypothetical protein
MGNWKIRPNFVWHSSFIIIIIINDDDDDDDVHKRGLREYCLVDSSSIYDNDMLNKTICWKRKVWTILFNLSNNNLIIIIIIIIIIWTPLCLPPLLYGVRRGNKEVKEKKKLE